MTNSSSLVLAIEEKINSYLGKEEIDIIKKAKDLIMGGLPTLQSETKVWLSSASVVKERMAALLASLSYLKNSKYNKLMHQYMFLVFNGELDEHKTKEERMFAAFYLDPKYQDLKEEIDTLESIEKYVDQVIWIINTMVTKCQEP